MIHYLGLWLGFGVAFNMWYWLSVLLSGARPLSRLIWTLVLVCLPAIGFVAWLVLGPREARA